MVYVMTDDIDCDFKDCGAGNLALRCFLLLLLLLFGKCKELCELNVKYSLYSIYSGSVSS